MFLGNVSIWKTHGEEILYYVGVIDPELVVLCGLYARSGVDPFCDLSYDTLDGGRARGSRGWPLLFDRRQRIRADYRRWREVCLWLLFLVLLLLLWWDSGA